MFTPYFAQRTLNSENFARVVLFCSEFRAGPLAMFFDHAIGWKDHCFIGAIEQLHRGNKVAIA